jgi:hypothetical protein
MQAIPHPDAEEVLVSTNGVIEVREIRKQLHYLVFNSFEDAILGGMDPKSAFEIFSKRAQAAPTCTKTNCIVVMSSKTDVWCKEPKAGDCLNTSGCHCKLWETRGGQRRLYGTDIFAGNPKPRRSGGSYECTCE